MLARPFAGTPGLRDVFGWNRTFEPGDLDTGLMALMEQGELLQRAGDGWRSTVRVASLGPDLMFHSAYPTDEQVDGMI